MLETIINQLKKFPLTRVSPNPEDHSLTAAVLVALHGDPGNPQVVLTQRANHLKNHAGEVAFPGGMWDAVDNHLLDTALREAHEEIGLVPRLVTPVATLPEASPKRRNLLVTPYVGLVESPLQFVADPSEIAAIFDLPVRLLLDINQYQYFEIKNEHGALRFPYLAYNEFKIWGFTLKVLVDMINATLDAGIELEYPSDQRINKLRQRGQ